MERVLWGGKNKATEDQSVIYTDKSKLKLKSRPYDGYVS